MGALDSITNRNEYFSTHYLDALLQVGLKDLRERWDEQEGRSEDTGRTRIRSLGRSFFAARAGAVEDRDQLSVLHDAVLDALGFAPDRVERDITRGGDAVLRVPVAATCETSTGLLLLAIEAGFATDVDAVLAEDGAGLLLDPPVAGADAKGRTKYAMTAATALVAHLFAAEDPPRYVLVLAGGIVILADRQKWGEGKYLAVNLDDALGRGDAKAKGELETIAGLFSADGLVPVEGQSVIDELAAASRKHAVGVSEDLRDGIRQSIELLANEVIKQRLAAHQAVYGGAVDPKELSRQCLRYLYRLVFLLFAEARPELGILPVKFPEYAEGYGLDRLRDLALADLHTDKAREGTHIQQSLALLFELVNNGYRHTGAQASMTFDTKTDAHIGLVFEPLKSDLFADSAVPLLDRIKLRNEVLQQVLALLMLSKEKKGADREFVSYANLGINQLGAVYEGLMAYTGFFAYEDLYEVARNGDAHKGSWVVPVDKADEYPDDVFVTRPSDTGVPVRVRHAKGSFVFRLSGRDRQRSASYYTPKVLTECVVKHALAELLDQDGITTPAQDILELTICEPALGSGAFLNEAIDQLAAEYLRRRQAEVGDSLDPESYLIELQKVKAHLALHQCYGVDLNSTAVELAEVSLWLNAMYPGLQAPWFGLHLRRGNSLIGARRATYAPHQLKEGAWLKAVPTDRKLSDGPVPDGEVHHFLLPAHGWAAVADAKEAKELRPDDAKKLREWRKSMSSLDGRQIGRLQALARRVESLWELATHRLTIAEQSLRRPIQVWNGPKASGNVVVSRDEIEAALSDPDSALGRLRLVMDAWCALWFWPIDAAGGLPEPPTMAEWLETLEGILGIDPGDAPIGQLDLFADLEALLAKEEQLAHDFSMALTSYVREEHPWMSVADEIEDHEGFFHWELEFAPVFGAGSFDLQLGNPPWVKLEWKDDVVLAEVDSWFGLIASSTAVGFAARRSASLHFVPVARSYLKEVASAQALQRWLGSALFFPLLEQLQTNLYLNFVSESVRRSGISSITALIHPVGHMTEPKGGPLREALYRRLRRHWHFYNKARLFEISDQREFSVNVYGAPRDVQFLALNSAHIPSTIDESLVHDGRGSVQGIKHPSGGWNRAGHAARVVAISSDELEVFRDLFDDSRVSPNRARFVRAYAQDDLAALRTLASYPSRLESFSYHATRGIEEDKAKRCGAIRRLVGTAASTAGLIYQGPNITVSNPCFQEARTEYKSNNDYDAVDLRLVPEGFLPRTTLQAADFRKLDEIADHWDGIPTTRFSRALYRRMLDTKSERTLQPALVPPGPQHVSTCNSVSLAELENTVLLVGTWSSIVVDFLVKVAGRTDLHIDLARRLPVVVDPSYRARILLRTARLNCVSNEYRSLWTSLYSVEWLEDKFTSVLPGGPNLGHIGSEWGWETPLRSPASRRLALIEIDALVAHAVGLSFEALSMIYRLHFGRLRQVEFGLAVDEQGSLSDESSGKACWSVDREGEMKSAYETFGRRLHPVVP